MSSNAFPRHEPHIDFDHHRPEHVVEAHAIYRQMRTTAPVFWSPHHGGFWGLASYAENARVLQEAQSFTSSKWRDATGSVQGGVSIPTSPLPPLIPTESDPPEWNGYRRVLAPLFTPAAMSKYKDDTLAYTTELLDRIIETGRGDLVSDLANPMPALMTMKLLGLPLNDWPRFAEPLHLVSYAPFGSEEMERAKAGIDWICEELRRFIPLKRSKPGNDMMSWLLAGTIDNTPLTDQQVFLLCFQVVAGGVDTTTALTTNVFMHLHKDRQARKQLMENQSLLPTAIEEFLRYFTPIQTLARNASQCASIDGRSIDSKERILCLLASANRDEKMFAEPEQVKLDRFPNKHLSFGLGIHRCIGSNLARIMFSAMLTQVLGRMADYTVDDSAAEHYPTMSTINGWSKIPVTFTPGPRIAARSVLPRW